DEQRDRYRGKRREMDRSFARVAVDAVGMGGSQIDVNAARIHVRTDVAAEDSGQQRRKQGEAETQEEADEVDELESVGSHLHISRENDPTIAPRQAGSKE